MSAICVVVADGRRARFFEAQPLDAPCVKATLVERSVLEKPDLRDLGASVTGSTRAETNTGQQAGPVRPIGAHRARHRLELDRRYRREIARRVAEMTSGWKSGTVVLIAEPRVLGLIRASLRESLDAEIELKELARDYAAFSAAEIRDRF